MSPAILIAAGLAVLLVTTLLLRSSGAGRELFGSDAWMLKSKPDTDSLRDAENTFIEHHEFWRDPDFDRDFWEQVPGESSESDEPDLGIASGDS